jgi:predicted house-cleaning noncanonical NTP pyrophosphatase (MazG superfamily)
MRLVKIVRSKLGLALGDRGGVVYKKIEYREDHINALAGKAAEELMEFARGGTADELADIYEAVRALVIVDCGLTWDQFMEIVTDKRERKGDFIDGIGMYVETKGRID